MSTLTQKRLADIEINQIIDAHGEYKISPWAWEDQILYFLMLDRFSDGNETEYRDNANNMISRSGTKLFTSGDNGNAIKNGVSADKWSKAGSQWCGGTLKGLEQKLGYLSRLGITAIWISPVFKQVSFQNTYHGYGIQNYLDIDKNFGSREDLANLIKTAHSLGIYVILDIILNHSGNIFSYENGYKGYPWNGNVMNVKGFNDENGVPSISFLNPIPSNAWPNGGIWPEEFQNPNIFTRKGSITNWDWYPEYLEGDFEDLKDITLGWENPSTYVPSLALENLGNVYKYWIAYADIDGFRVDTVKHMDIGASRYFASVIHEFAQSIGKENFYLIGEITGGREFAFDTLEQTGLNAALGIDDIPDKLEYLIKGYRNPESYFNLFRNSLLLDKGSHTWFRDKVVTVLDDHDQVRKGNNKARFCAFGSADINLIASVIGLQATSIGIPCIYYGTEQMFDGEGGNDRYIRECMFGGEFGAFRSRECHFFNEESPSYKAISSILKIRNHPDQLVLRRGRQYLRQISKDGVFFYIPKVLGDKMESVVAWSRILSEDERLMAFNTGTNSEEVYSIVDHRINASVLNYRCIYSSDASQINGVGAVCSTGDGARAVKIKVPGHGFTIWEPKRN
jgi:glycosidase